MSLAELRFVAGAPVPADGVVEVFNPASPTERVGSIPRIQPEAIDSVVVAAQRAQREWAATPPRTRFGLISEALRAFDVGGMSELLTREQGKVLSESARELQYFTFPVTFLEPHIEWLERGEDLGDSGVHRTRVYRDPFGVVGIISPWNVPVSMAIVTIAPALLGGNSVVVHVPASAPLTALTVFSTLAEALPPGVLSLISSPDTRVAQGLVEHPLVRQVHFTGSTGVGALVAAEAAPTATALTLELGGNDPAIVLDDALDDPAVYQKIVTSTLAMGGQACVAIKRLYVPRRRVEETLQGLGEVLDRTVVGDGLDPAVTLGAMHTAAVRDRITGLVERSRADGGRVHEFGRLLGDPKEGYFVRPTLVTGLAQDHALVREEQFGPSLPIIGYDSEQQAVDMANDSEFGLGSSVWSADEGRAMTIARQLQAGMTWINQHGGAGIDGRAPWGGVKQSGIGRGGANRAGLECFTELHAITSTGHGH